MADLRNRAQKAARAKGDDEKRHRDRRHAEAKEWAAKAVEGALELSDVELKRLRRDDHPTAAIDDRPSFGFEHDGLRFVARSVAGEQDFLGLGGYRVFVLIGDNERLVDGLAALGDLLDEREM